LSGGARRRWRSDHRRFPGGRCQETARFRHDGGGPLADTAARTPRVTLRTGVQNDFTLKTLGIFVIADVSWQFS
jgi:hypothetical protein